MSTLLLFKTNLNYSFSRQLTKIITLNALTLFSQPTKIYINPSIMNKYLLLFALLISISCSDNCDEEVALIHERYNAEIEQHRELKDSTYTAIEIAAWSKRLNLLFDEKKRAIDNACD